MQTSTHAQDRHSAHRTWMFFDPNGQRLEWDKSAKEAEEHANEEARQEKLRAINLQPTDYSLVVNDGELKSEDGVVLAAPNAEAMFTFDVPVLPGVSGVQSAPLQLGEQLSLVADTATGVLGGTLEWQALVEALKTLQDEIKTSRDFRNASFSVKMATKEAVINETEKRIEAERDAVAFRMWTAIIAGVVQIAAAAIAYAQTPGEGASEAQRAAGSNTGQLINSLGQATASIINSVGEYINKTSGPQREADDAQIRTDQLRMLEEVWGNIEQELQASAEEAQQQFRRINEALARYIEMKLQATQQIAQW